MSFASDAPVHVNASSYGSVQKSSNSIVLLSEHRKHLNVVVFVHQDRVALGGGSAHRLQHFYIKFFVYQKAIRDTHTDPNHLAILHTRSRQSNFIVLKIGDFSEFEFICQLLMRAF